MRIEIRSHSTLTELLSTEPSVWDVLLIVSPGGAEPSESVTLLAARTLRLSFDDCEVVSPGMLLPTEEDVRQALEWSVGSKHLVVSCYLGRSRSSSLGYVIACRDYAPHAALKILDPAWHKPNRLIVDLGSDILRNPTISDACFKWLARHAKIQSASPNTQESGS